MDSVRSYQQPWFPQWIKPCILSGKYNNDSNMQELVSSSSKMFIYFVTQTCLGELEVSSSRLKALLFLVSKIVTYSMLTWTLMLRLESIFSLMSSHWTDTRNQCNVHLIRAELQVKVNFTYNCISFITTWRKERCPKCCRQFRKILLEKETQRIKISYCILGQKKKKNTLSELIYQRTERNIIKILLYYSPTHLFYHFY